MKTYKSWRNSRVFALGLCATIGLYSCAQEEEVTIDQPETNVTAASAKAFTPDNRNLTTMATFNEVRGEFGDLFMQDYDGKVVRINSLADYDPQVAGYVHFDIDRLNITKAVYDDIKQWAEQSNASLIFESGSKDHEAMRHFYGAVVSADQNVAHEVKGLIVENSTESEVTRTTLISEEVSISAQGVIASNFNGMAKAQSAQTRATPVNPTTVRTYPDKKTTCIRGRCTTTLGTPLYTVTNGFRGVPNSSSSYDYRASGVSYNQMGAKMVTFNFTSREVLKRGSIIHDSKRFDGSYSCDQRATYSESTSVSRSWSAGIKLDAKTEKLGNALKSFLKELTFGASASIGGSRTSGTTNASSIRMVKRFAQAVIYTTKWNANLGYWTGNVTYKLQRKKKTGQRRVWRTYANVKSNFNQYARDNTWEGDQPYSPRNNGQSFIAFGWDEWNPPGESGPNCGGRSSSTRVASNSATWWK